MGKGRRMNDERDYVAHAEDEIRQVFQGFLPRDEMRSLHSAAAQTYALLAVAKALDGLRRDGAAGV
jgi:hypothetical protein